MGSHRKVVLATVVLGLLFAAGLARTQQAKERPQAHKPVIRFSPDESPQVVLFQIRVSESSKAELEDLFRKEVLPVVLKNNKVIAVKTYAKLVGGGFTYVAEVELRQGVPLNYGTVFEILSNGKTPEQTFATINHLASFFQESSSSVVLYRPDLSISRRNTMGYRAPAAEKEGQ